MRETIRGLRNQASASGGWRRDRNYLWCLFGCMEGSFTEESVRGDKLAQPDARNSSLNEKFTFTETVISFHIGCLELALTTFYRSVSLCPHASPVRSSPQGRLLLWFARLVFNNEFRHGREWRWPFSLQHPKFEKAPDPSMAQRVCSLFWSTVFCFCFWGIKIGTWPCRERGLHRELRISRIRRKGFKGWQDNRR